MFVFPTRTQNLALEHLKKHVSASPSAVFFFQRHHVTRAHRAAITLSARSEPDAAERCLGKRTIVVGKFKMRFRFQWSIVRPQPQILSRQVSVDNFVRIQLVIRIPRGLELAESSDQLGAEHLRKQRGSRLAVAMLAGERTAITNHQVSCPLDEF